MDSMFYTLLARSLAGGGGGGGGTTDFNDLSNKPKVNNTTLVGNKTSSDLGLQPAINVSNKLSADLIAETDSKKFNVQADWGQVVSTAPDFIKNKPVLGTAAATDASAYATAAQGSKANSAIQGVKLNGGSQITPDSNKVVNITIPTTAADVSALPDTTKYAAALSLTINSSTFVMTGQLKDQNGNNIGTAQTIDLPLESVVVGGSYNSQTQKVVLTLQNGNIIEFSVADLVYGLQTELSETNKLNPAYINYDSTHRAVSDAEKSAWNAKQDALTTAQLAAVNSGITSEDVTQIETNKTNILWNTKNGVSNVLPLNSVYKRGVHADVTEPSKIHFYGTPDSSGTLSGLTKRMTLKEGTYTIIVNTDFDTSLNTDIYLYDMTTSDTILTIETSGTYEFTANPTHEYLYAFYFNQGVTVDFNYQVTVRPKNSPDVGFQPHALSNAELTAAIQALQAQLSNQ